MKQEKKKERVIFSLGMSGEINNKIQKDANKADRSKNYIINCILDKHYGVKTKTK